jgi:hypothetical protein
MQQSVMETQRKLSKQIPTKVKITKFISYKKTKKTTMYSLNAPARRGQPLQQKMKAP